MGTPFEDAGFTDPARTIIQRSVELEQEKRWLETFEGSSREDIQAEIEHQKDNIRKNRGWAEEAKREISNRTKDNQPCNSAQQKLNSAINEINKAQSRIQALEEKKRNL
jgi:DNA repair exonuclease SbcCD ATPase subunit